MKFTRRFGLLLCLVATGVAQQNNDPVISDQDRKAAVEQLAVKLSAGYVLPESAPKIVRALRSGDFGNAGTAMQFLNAVNRTLAAAGHDKHLKIYFDPQRAEGAPGAGMMAEPRERLNYGFIKLERLKGNVGYLEITSFQSVDRAADTARDFLGGLAGFDAIILDLRKNGGGNTPMVTLVASYFFGSESVHLTNIYWRDIDKTTEFWTSPRAPGRHSPRQPLYILTSALTFSAAEDFAFSMQKLKRAVVIGERTGGGAHSGRGPQRISPLFTAFVPVGRSFNPVDKTNWEGVGVEPDIKTTADQALNIAHLAALGELVKKETDEQWRRNLQNLIQQIGTP